MRCFFSRPSGTNPSSRVYVTKSAGVCVSGHVGCVCERDCVTGLVRLLPPPSSDTALVSRLGFTAFRWQSMTATDSGRARFDRGARAVRLPLRGWEARCLENAFSGVSMHHHLEQAAYISVGDPLTWLLLVEANKVAPRSRVCLAACPSADHGRLSPQAYHGPWCVRLRVL